MTNKSKLTIPMATVILLAAPAMAQEAMIDVDGDGMYSFAEVQAVLPEFTEADFVLLDASGDGFLDADEIAAGVEAGLLPA